MSADIKEILYTTDLSRSAAHALQYALSLAKKYDAHITILHVMEEMSENAKLVMATYLDKEFRKGMAEKRETQAMEALKTRLNTYCAKEMGEDPSLCDLTTLKVRKGYPEEQILGMARELDSDLIIMGAHEKGFSHTFLGSVAKRVLRRSRRPVFIVPLPRE